MLQTSAALATLVLVTCTVFGGCSEDDEAGGPWPAGAGGTGGSAAAGGTTTAVGGSGGSGGAINPGQTRMTMSGDATWTVTFDAVAQAAGATNCSYTRHYEGVQDQSAPWLCPACEVIFRASVQMTAGQQDCYVQVTDVPLATEEWLGYANGVWWRGRGGPMADQGTVVVDATSAVWANHVEDLEAPVGGTLAFDVAGTFTLGEEAGDPMHGWVAADDYSCGWPKSDPAEYAGNYALALGQVVPDGLFKDECQQIVRLHDFDGAYVMYVMSAVDCPACNGLASEEEQFIADMALQGIEVHVVTLLAPALDDPIGETTTTMLDNWSSSHGLASPVLADRAWGLCMFIPVLGEETAYPAWILTDPDLRVLDFGTGFQGFAEHEATILADAQ